MQGQVSEGRGIKGSGGKREEDKRVQGGVKWGVGVLTRSSLNIASTTPLGASGEWDRRVRVVCWPGAVHLPVRAESGF